MDVKYWVGLALCIAVALILGYLIGKNSLKPKGDIEFELYRDDETNEDSVRCTFKLDLDIDQIVNEDYILFGVVKNKAVLDYYRNHK